MLNIVTIIDDLMDEWSCSLYFITLTFLSSKIGAHSQLLRAVRTCNTRTALSYHQLLIGRTLLLLPSQIGSNFILKIQSQYLNNHQYNYNYAECVIGAMSENIYRASDRIKAIQKVYYVVENDGRAERWLFI